MYEFIILSLLMRMPMHGYLIAKIANDQLGPWAKISSGTLYTILAKLERLSLIAPAGQQSPASATTPRRRTSNQYMITEAGRSRFYQLMMDTASNLNDYQRLFYYKLISFDLIQPAERLLLWNHYLNYCQTSALYLQSEAAALEHELAGAAQHTFREQALRVMRRMEQQWTAEVAWARAEQARAQVAATPEPPDKADNTGA